MTAAALAPGVVEALERLAQTGKIAYSLTEAAEASSLGRSVIYERIGTGELTARKCGRRTLIMRDDLVTFLLSLPAAELA